MATEFKNKLISNIGTSEQLIVESTNPNSKITVIGLSLANVTTDAISVPAVTGSAVSARIRIENTSTSESAFYLKDVMIPTSQSLRAINGGERLVLGPNTQLYISSNIPNSIDVVVSYVEIT